MDEQFVKFSIVICTYNRADFLRSALSSLTCQTSGNGIFEVIIVNNNSNDHTQAVADEFLVNHKNFRGVIEAQQGLGHARNRGYKEAKTDWIAYLDDDAKVSANYAERIIHVIEHYNFDCFGGIYLPWFKYGKPKWFKNSYGSNGFKIQRTGLLENDYCSGGIIVFKKSILEHFNGFPVDIGMKGKKIAYGEETLLQVKMRKQGYTIGFDPALQVEHVVGKHKLTLWWFIRSSFAAGRDSWYAFDIIVTKRMLLTTAACGLYHLIQDFFKYTPELTRKDYYIQNWIIDVFRRLSYNLGQIFTILRN